MQNNGNPKNICLVLKSGLEGQIRVYKVLTPPDWSESHSWSMWLPNVIFFPCQTRQNPDMHAFGTCECCKRASTSLILPQLSRIIVYLLMSQLQINLEMLAQRTLERLLKSLGKSQTFSQRFCESWIFSNRWIRLPNHKTCESEIFFSTNGFWDPTYCNQMILVRQLGDLSILETSQPDLSTSRKNIDTL